jgi:5'-deoxynucleotidase YfbR-like HD superfamily hydrolase
VLRKGALLNSGHYVDLLEMKLSDVRLRDIVPPLSKICRYGGQCSQFYSVAQHSVVLSLVVPTHLAQCALIHDFTEAYMGDVPRPIKHLVPAFTEFEEKLGHIIFQRLGVDYDLMQELAYYDSSICLDEMQVLMPEEDQNLYAKGYKPLGAPINPQLPSIAEGMLWARFTELFGEGMLHAAR